MQPETYPTVTCHKCGTMVEARYVEPTKKKMVEQKLCFSCLFWADIVAVKDTRTIVNGGCYVVAPEPRPGTPNDFKGHAGRRFDIVYNDGRKVTTTNLWSNGSIPSHFRDQLPDNAVFEKVH